MFIVGFEKNDVYYFLGMPLINYTNIRRNTLFASSTS